MIATKTHKNCRRLALIPELQDPQASSAVEPGAKLSRATAEDSARVLTVEKKLRGLTIVMNYSDDGSV